MKFNPKIIQYILAAVAVAALVFVVVVVVRIFNRPDGTAKEVKAELSEIKAGLMQVGEQTDSILLSAEAIQRVNESIQELIKQDAHETGLLREEAEADARRLRQKIDALKAGFEKDREKWEEVKRTSTQYPPLLAK